MNIMFKLVLIYVLVSLAQNGHSERDFGWSEIHSVKRHIAPSNVRIIGGGEVVPHSVPFQVALRINSNAHCGGFLVSENFVLSAGHCGEVIRRVIVTLGAHNLSNAEENTQVIISGSKVIMHAEYDTDTLQNDIALIQLSESASLNDYIKLAKLPPKSDAGNLYLGETVTATGWGLIKDVPYPSIRELSDVLQSVDVIVMRLTDCYFYYKDLDTPQVFDTDICTKGYGNKGTCNGDSGGPLILDEVVIGITSFGTDLCETCAPSVYTRIESYLDWIAVNSDVVIN